MSDRHVLSPDRLRSLLEAFTGRTILVVGDLMLDEYVWGRVNRISPEAPVMVVEVQETTHCLGGAGNVATNIQAMGGQAVLSGVVGADETGRTLTERAAGCGCHAHGIFAVEGRPTTIKTRIVAHSQQVVRVDRETKGPISGEALDQVMDFVRTAVPRVEAGLLSDYAKGMLTDAIVGESIRLARGHGKPLAANLKPPRVDPFAGATFLTMNLHEAERATNESFPDEAALLRAGAALRERLSCDALLVTRGADGVCLFTADADPLLLPARRVEVYDVAGAGDTVIGAATMALAAGATFAEAAAIGNLAGNVKVTKLGVAPVSRDEIRHMAEEA